MAKANFKAGIYFCNFSMAFVYLFFLDRESLNEKGQSAETQSSRLSSSFGGQILGARLQ